MKVLIKVLFIMLFGCLGVVKAADTSYEMVAGLKGSWKFMIGDNLQWASPNYNTDDWETIHVPSNWENQGFPGYDGYAWYRREVTVGNVWEKASLMLFLGYIDDVDEVYFNGVKIGHKGSFPPDFWTAYNSERRYLIPSELVRYNEPNVIAVRVYDSQLDGGILGGDISIRARHRDLPFDFNLEGYWRFSKGDDLAWADPLFDDSQWRKVVVPGFWEDQIGWYDGFGWYRRRINVPLSMAGKRFVLMLGKIDDIDEVYINGKRVAGTGKFDANINNIYVGDEYSRQRYYYLEESDIVAGKVNTIAVRVYDEGGEGGIYSGEVGLVELKRFVSFWRAKK
ncbi:beta galactosidase jelly roll domain-containing protein [Geofilum sp. OHC36d9]|uniref:beta galactosidase jelly roll domain-containing protein n=1 Tax=Geofilum sp. OHC36d9 TaxID=3458413 RepID=UPI0040349542